MQGNKMVLDCLQRSVEREIAAITAYMTQAAILENWHLSKLAQTTNERGRQEMGHMDKLIERTVFLDGIPPLYRASDFQVGVSVKDMLEIDLGLELEAVRLYNEFATMCQQCGDEGTRELFSDLVEDEEEHVRYLEAQLTQIELMGLSGYLQNQA